MPSSRSLKTPTEPGAPGQIDFGRIVGAHGIRGEVKLRPHNPDSELVASLSELRLEYRGQVRTHVVTAAREHGGVWLLQLEGVTSRNDAEALAGSIAWIDEAQLEPLPDHQYYHHQLVGLAVVDESGEPLGEVRRLLTAGGSDILEIIDGKRERLVPMIDEFVRSIDLAERRIVVRPMPGLFD